MIAVRMVQMAADQVIDVIAVRNRFVPAPGAVHMARVMTAAGVVLGATFGIGGADLDAVLIDVAGVRMMQVAVVQVVDVIAMTDGGVATAGAMLVVVVAVLPVVAVAHDYDLPFIGAESAPPAHSLAGRGRRENKTAAAGCGYDDSALVSVATL